MLNVNTMTTNISTFRPNLAELDFVIAQQQASGGSTILMMGIIFAIFYFLLIRPQQKEHKAHLELLMGLQKGDNIATNSGLHGRVHEVSGETVVLEIADRVRITVDKTAVKRKIVTVSAGAVKGA